MCRLSWNLGASTSWNPQGLSKPVMGLLYLYICCVQIAIDNIWDTQEWFILLVRAICRPYKPALCMHFVLCLCGFCIIAKPTADIFPKTLSLVPSLVEKFPAFYVTRRFITAFTSARHLSLSWARSIQSMLPLPTFLKIHLNIILPSTPGSSKCFLYSGFPTKTLYTPLHHTCYMPRPSDSSRFDHPKVIGWGVHIVKLVRLELNF